MPSWRIALFSQPRVVVFAVCHLHALGVERAYLHTRAFVKGSENTPPTHLPRYLSKVSERKFSSRIWSAFKRAIVPRVNCLNAITLG